MSAVRYEHVEKRFDSVAALKSLDLDVPDRAFLALLGPSGCGKTTALRILAGLDLPTSGRVLIGERHVTRLQPRDRDIAMVFHSYALYPHMTVGENIAYPLRIRRIAPAEQARMVAEVAAALEVDHLLARRPRQLSGGQRQRVALARAIVRRPAVFLMDEPLSNLDAKLRGHMRAELKHMQHQLGIATIYVTHDQIEAMTLGHRVAVLNQGRLQQIDTPHRIYDDPANIFVAGFVGSPPMNFVGGELERGRFLASDASLPTNLVRTRKGVLLGLRTEDCRVVGAGVPDCLGGTIYSNELIGDHVLVTCQIDGNPIVVKAEKSFTGEIGAAIGIQTAAGRCYLFDQETGDRLR